MDTATGEYTAQLERHLHDPRLRAARHRRLRRQAHDDRHGASRTGSSSSSATTTARRSPKILVRPADRHLAGLQQLGRQVALLRQVGGANTVAGTERAVKVSFDRPLDNAERPQPVTSGPTSTCVSWLERQGYDVSYTDDVAVHQNPARAATAQDRRRSPATPSTGRSSSSTASRRRATPASNIALVQRQHGVLEGPLRGRRPTLVCYKTVQGDGSGGSGRVTPNDWGPDGVKGTADDALGLDGNAGTADDHPENSTTTFRDNGAPDRRPERPAGGRVGPDMPENQLFGVMYVGDNDRTRLPADGSRRERQRRVRRATASGATPASRRTRRPTSATNIVGWEWDAVPTQAQYPREQPSRRQAAHEHERARPRATTSWLLDEGRQRGTDPAEPASPARSTRSRYTAPSGAQVFAGGHDAVVVGALRRGRPADPAGDLQHPLRHGRPAGPPDGITIDPAGSNTPPVASFTLTPDDGPPEPGGHLRRLRVHRSGRHDHRSTSGTSTATAPSRRTPARQASTTTDLHRPRAPSTCACASPTTAARPTSPCARSP